MFVLGNFTGAAGAELPWKIECDYLSRDEWECIAAVVAPHLPRFKYVYGVPTGGLVLADVLSQYAVKGNMIGLPPLIVDDVWTTGTTMRAFTEKALGLRPQDWNGFVAFSRAATLPENVRAFMKWGMI